MGGGCTCEEGKEDGCEREREGGKVGEEKRWREGKREGIKRQLYIHSHYSTDVYTSTYIHDSLYIILHIFFHFVQLQMLQTHPT